MAESYIPANCEILDIGGFDGSFLFRLRNKIKRGVCIDPYIADKEIEGIEFIKSHVEESLPFPDNSFDIITMLAVYEHLGEYRYRITAESFRVLRSDGYVLLTVPSSSVDYVLKILRKIGLIDMHSFEEHKHFKVSETVKIFLKSGFKLERWSKFQLGFNNLFIFQKVNCL